jgi:hypothetical protein
MGEPLMLDEQSVAAVADALAERVAPAPALLDAEGAARLLGLFNAEGEPLASWVKAKARTNEIPHIRLGHYVRFDPNALRQWWLQRQRGPAS